MFDIARSTWAARSILNWTIVHMTNEQNWFGSIGLGVDRMNLIRFLTWNRLHLSLNGLFSSLFIVVSWLTNFCSSTDCNLRLTVKKNSHRRGSHPWVLIRIPCASPPASLPGCVILHKSLNLAQLPLGHLFFYTHSNKSHMRTVSCIMTKIHNCIMTKPLADKKLEGSSFHDYLFFPCPFP